MIAAERTPGGLLSVCVGDQHRDCGRRVEVLAGNLELLLNVDVAEVRIAFTNPAISVFTGQRRYVPQFRSLAK